LNYCELKYRATPEICGGFACAAKIDWLSCLIIQAPTGGINPPHLPIFWGKPRCFNYTLVLFPPEPRCSIFVDYPLEIADFTEAGLNRPMNGINPTWLTEISPYTKDVAIWKKAADVVINILFVCHSLSRHKTVGNLTSSRFEGLYYQRQGETN
jgi:hypothetical protein